MEEIEVRIQNSESGKFEKVKIKVEPELTFGSRNQTIRDATTYDSKGNPKLDFVLQQELMVVKMIVEAPFDISINGIRLLYPDDGDMLVDLGKKKEPVNQEGTGDNKGERVESEDKSRESENRGDDDKISSSEETKDKP